MDIELGPRNNGTEDEEFGHYIDERFKPLFDMHGNQGVSVAELETELEETGIENPEIEERLKLLIRKADSNKDGLLTYTEFRGTLMKPGTSLKKHRSALDKFVSAALVNILPKEERKLFIDHYDCKPPPMFMIAISVIEVIVFIIYAVELSDSDDPVTATSGVPMYSPLIYKPTRRYEAWRFLTYMLVHQGYEHLIANLTLQLLLGVFLEMVHGWWRVLALYSFGVVAGSLAHSVADQYTNLCGASGGMYSLIGAHVASVVINWKEMNAGCGCGKNPLLCLASAKFRLFLMCFIAVPDTGLAVYRRFSGNEEKQVGITAHVAGLTTGVLLGVVLLKNFRPIKWEKNLKWVTLSVFVALTVAAVIFNGLHEGYPPTDWSACCP